MGGAIGGRGKEEGYEAGREKSLKKQMVAKEMLKHGRREKKE